MPAAATFDQRARVGGPGVRNVQQHRQVAVTDELQPNGDPFTDPPSPVGGEPAQLGDDRIVAFGRKSAQAHRSARHEALLR